jgi:hypothetical protein
MTTATKPAKPKADRVYTCWNAGFDTVLNFGAARGQRLKGDHAYVQRHPADFIPESEVLGGASLPDPANVPPVDPPEPIGRVKLKVLPGLGSRADDLVGGGTEQQITYRGKTYRTGETFAAQGADAAYLLDTGCVEIVGSPLKRLRPSRSAGLPRTVT